MINKPMVVVAAVVVVAGGGVAYYFHSRNALPQAEPAVVQSAPPADSSEPQIEHPVPRSSSPPAGPLPALNDSDPAMKDALAAVLGTDGMQYVVPESMIRHLVVTVDNLARQKVPVSKRPTASVSGAFLAQGDELNASIDPANFARYDAMVNVLRKLDTQQLADVYLRFYPLFQNAYRDLGYPNGYFNDRLVQVIDSMLATPQPADPIQLTRPNVMYTFADPALESLPAGQKLLLRMGPNNAAAVKAKLKELRAIAVATAPPKH